MRRHDDAERIARDREADAEAAQRERRRDMVRTGLLCLVWAGLGIVLIGWSVYTTDEELGHVARYLGLAVGNGGILYSLLAFYRRGEDRGDH